MGLKRDYRDFVQSKCRLDARFSSSSNGFVIPIVISLGFAGIISACGLIPSDNTIARAWLSSLAGFGIIWLYILKRHGGTIPLSTNVMAMVGFSVTHLLPPLYLSIRIYYKPSVDPYNVADMYPVVALVTAIGALAMLIGHEVVARRSRTTALPSLPSRMTLSGEILPVIIAIAIVVWMARGILLVNGAYYWAFSNIDFLFGRWYSLSIQISKYGLFLPIFFWVSSRVNPRRKRWAWLATVGELVWVIPSGATQAIIETLLAFLLIAWWYKGHLPRMRVALLLLFVVFAMPVIREYRYTIGQLVEVNQRSAASSLAAFQLAQERFEQTEGNSILDYSDSFARRIYDAQFLGYLLKHYRDVYDWEYGKTYSTRLPFLVLPYFLFPYRPIMQVPIDHWFKFVAAGSCPSTFLGEAYVNFGYLGILIVPFLFGIILGAYDAMLLNWRDNPFVVAVYLLFASFTPFMVTQSLASWLGYLRNAVLMALAARLAIRFLSLRRRYTPS